VFENRVLRRIFGQKKDEVVGGWRKLQNEGFYILYSSPRIIKLSRMRWAGHVAQMGKRYEYMMSMGNSEENRPVGRSRRRWVDNFKMDLREIGWDGMGWIDQAQDGDQWRPLVKSVINLLVPQNVGKFLSSYTTDSFSRMAMKLVMTVGNNIFFPLFVI
jgi:hypothetical protein